MAYQTGAGLADITYLLNELRLFCVANGFTQHEWNQGSIDWTGLATSTTLVLSKDGVYHSFWLTHGIQSQLYGVDFSYAVMQKLATGYTPGNDPWAHPGTWGAGSSANYNGTATVGTGPGSVQRYHLFLDGSEVICVWQNAAGWWRVFGFGQVNQKLTTFTGGGFCLGSFLYYGAPQASSTASAYHFFDKCNSAPNIQYAGGVLRADLDATPQYHHGGYTSYLGAAAAQDPTGGDCSGGEWTHRSNARFPYFLLEGYEIERGSNNYSLVSLMKPVTIWLRRASSRIMAAARLTTINTINVSNYAAGQEVVLGADTWVIFPLAVKSAVELGTVNVLNTHILGYAVKKVV